MSDTVTTSPGDLGVAAEDPDRTGAGGALDPHQHILRGHRHGVAELLVEDPRQIARVLDKGVVAVARAREPGHEVLVVAETETDGAHRYALFLERCAERAELGRRVGADVGETVGEQDDPVDPFAVEELADLGGADADPGEERRRAPGWRLSMAASTAVRSATLVAGSRICTVSS